MMDQNGNYIPAILEDDLSDHPTSVPLSLYFQSVNHQRHISFARPANPPHRYQLYNRPKFDLCFLNIADGHSVTFISSSGDLMILQHKSAIISVLYLTNRLHYMFHIHTTSSMCTCDDSSSKTSTGSALPTHHPRE